MLVGVDGTGVSVGGTNVSVCEAVAGGAVTLGGADGTAVDALQAAKPANRKAKENDNNRFMAFSRSLQNKVGLGHENGTLPKSPLLSVHLWRRVCCMNSITIWIAQP